MSETEYIPAIGLEVHVQLGTRSKMFCGCPTDFGAAPNTQVCPVCLGYPGAMPVMNEQAVRYTVMTGLMIGSTIGARSKFDRKSYFYPDMPKNYQISQYDRPLCEGGGVPIETADGRRDVRIVRIHLEEDVAKNLHFASSSGVDFNRAGLPLMEIVTHPDMTSPEEAHEFLVALKRIVTYAGVSPCNLEQGNLRCDVNCSVRPAGSPALGTKTEIKNLNTFRGVQHALRFEIARQIAVRRAGGTVVQETRRWDAESGATFSMRSKEDAHDYRYFAEPDLMPVVPAPEQVAAWRAALPELPDSRRRRLVETYGLPEYDAGVLVRDRAVVEFFEAAARLSRNPKGVSNWIMTEVLRLLAERETGLEGLKISPEALAALVELADSRTVNSTTAKEIFTVLVEQGGDPRRIVEERGLAQVSDGGAIEALVEQAIAENPASAADYRGGKARAAQFLVGQVMRLSRGKANPRMVMEMIRSKLG